MTVPTCTADSCAERCPDMAFLCRRHTGKLRDALDRIWQLAGELETTIIRQSRIGSDNAGRRSAETLLPFALNPSMLPDRLQNTLATWARHIAEAQNIGIELRQRPRPAGPSCSTPRGECRHGTCLQIHQNAPAVAQLADWLAGQVDWFRRRREVVEMLEDMTRLAGEVERMVDRPGDRWYAGACDGCGTHLYAAEAASAIHCGGCRRSYDVQTRRTQLLASARDTLAHAELIGRALSALGESVTSSQIRNWKDRGQLIPHGNEVLAVTENGPRTRPLYRVGDVIELARAAAAKKRKVSA